MRQQTTFRLITPISVFILLFITRPVTLAADKLVVVDPQKVDADFHVQGEYAGEVSLDGLKGRFGMQVIARGEGKFDAVGYWGGLPGAGWNRSAKLKFTGQTKTGTAFLKRVKDPEKGREAIVIAGAKIEYGELTLGGPDGGRLGTLPRVVRQSPTLGKRPPPGAVVLFDGTSVAAFVDGKMTADGLLQHGTKSKQLFQNARVHLEFRLPYMPQDRGQNRGNSGCYLQGRYEVQVLDSFGLEGNHNECGGIYSVRDADINMCFPPLSWQTYDIEFTAAKFDAAGKKVESARMTVYHNGVLVQKEVEVPHTTTAALIKKEGADPGPLFLQDHDCPLRYRNIWVDAR